MDTIVLLLALIPAFPRIDAHAHTAPPPQAFLDMLGRLDVCLVNVTLVDPHAPPFDKPEPQTTIAAETARNSRNRIAWASAFDPAPFESAGFESSTSAHLLSTFSRGAVAVKMYKSVGLDLRSKTGQYVMPDDPAFGPVLETIARSGRTLLTHLAEPKSSWQPLDPEDPHYRYYRHNPEWHMFRHPEGPSWESIIAARDRMLEAHPRLRVIGCHLGSMEHDVAEIAKRLDRYPNFAVDTAARVPNLVKQDPNKVRDFLIRYQDRVLWGTDMIEISWANPADAMARWEAVYDREWRYFSRDLNLPASVLRKLFRDNALRWIPRLKEAVQCGERKAS